MTYTILNSYKENETLITEVEYNFDGKLVKVKIPHYMPDSKEAIETGIKNRAVTELRRLNSIELNDSLISDIDLGKPKSIL